MYPHDRTQERLTDYVLGELSATEREHVEAHLAHCAECASEARELALAFQGIGLAEEPAAPPPHLRARVLDRLAHEQPARRPPSDLLLSARSTRRSPGTWWLAAAAAVVVLALGGLLARNVQRAARLEADLERARDDVARLTRNADTVAAQADLAVSILTAPDMRRIDLEGLDVSRNATARAYWSASRGLLIVADRLPTPPPGRIYQVWLIGSQSTGPVSAGLIDPGSSGRGMLIVPPPGGVTGSGVTVAVTDEPPGGVASPSGSKHLIGSA
jgi:anti-sigma-K factor RskA